MVNAAKKSQLEANPDFVTSSNESEESASSDIESDENKQPIKKFTSGKEQSEPSAAQMGLTQQSDQKPCETNGKLIKFVMIRPESPNKINTYQPHYFYCQK